MYKLKRKFLSLRITIFVLLPAFMTPFAAEAEPASSHMNQRIQSAHELIKEIDQFQINAKKLHVHSENIIAQAERLRGGASKFDINTPPVNSGVKMNSAQLLEAKRQYQADIKEFTEHAKAYNQHLQDFQTLLGECHKSSQALAAVLQKYELHVTQFHLNMPNIRPPHICGALQERVGDLTSEAHRMMGDQIRVAEAEAKLDREQQGLQLADGAVGTLQTKAMLTAQRAEGEFALASEFGRLKEEYDMLKTEKDTIYGAGKTSVKLTSVSGKVIKK